jgi:hypothetical protein
MRPTELDTRVFLERHGNPRRRLRGAGLLFALTGAIALLIAASASANNDPHRIYLPLAPFDLPASYCGFPVHIEPLANREYAKVSQGADGSTVYKITGSLFVGVTNTTTGRATTLNISGPGTFTFSVDGTVGTFDGRGLSLLYASNVTQFGLPSNLVVTSGPGPVSIDLVNGTILSLPTTPHVLLDVCAALSP